MKGASDKLKKGGAGVPLDELEGFIRLADEAVKKLVDGKLQPERKRIGRIADAFNIDKELIFNGVIQARFEQPEGEAVATSQPLDATQVAGSPAPTVTPASAQAARTATAPSAPQVAATGKEAEARAAIIPQLEDEAFLKQYNQIIDNPDAYSEVERTAAADEFDRRKL